MKRGPDPVLFVFGASLVAWAGLVVHAYPGDPIVPSALWFMGVPGGR